MTYSGIALLEKIKKDGLEDETDIEVLFDGVKLFKIQYINEELYWKPDTFKASMLYDDDYTFRIKNKIKKIETLSIGDIHENFNSMKKIASVLNEVIDKINDMED